MQKLCELLRQGRYMLPCCLMVAVFLSACAEQRNESVKDGGAEGTGGASCLIRPVPAGSRPQCPQGGIACVSEGAPQCVRPDARCMTKVDQEGKCYCDCMRY